MFECKSKQTSAIAHFLSGHHCGLYWEWNYRLPASKMFYRERFGQHWIPSAEAVNVKRIWQILPVFLKTILNIVRMCRRKFLSVCWINTYAVDVNPKCKAGEETNFDFAFFA